jgi:hypothetical protein
MGLFEIKTFHDAVSVNGDGEEYAIPKRDGNITILLSITGVSISTRTITFEVSDFDDNWTSIMGYNVADLSTGANNTTGTSNEKWKISVGGWKQFRARLSNFSGTSTTVKGSVLTGQ